VPTLLLILTVVLAESAWLVVRGVEGAAMWGLANIASIQVAYFGGICLRLFLEQAGYRLPPVDVRS